MNIKLLLRLKTVWDNKIVEINNAKLLLEESVIYVRKLVKESMGSLRYLI
jgi:hypothetical protein